MVSASLHHSCPQNWLLEASSSIYISFLRIYYEKSRFRFTIMLSKYYPYIQQQFIIIPNRKLYALLHINEYGYQHIQHLNSLFQPHILLVVHCVDFHITYRYTFMTRKILRVFFLNQRSTSKINIVALRLIRFAENIGP